jgi:hypothetical protein
MAARNHASEQLYQPYRFRVNGSIGAPLGIAFGGEAGLASLPSAQA